MKAVDIYIHPSNFMKEGTPVKTHILSYLPKKDIPVNFIVSNRDLNNLQQALAEMNIRNKYEFDIYQSETRQEASDRVKKIVPKGRVPSWMIDAALRQFNKELK